MSTVVGGRAGPARAAAIVPGVATAVAIATAPPMASALWHSWGVK